MPELLKRRYPMVIDAVCNTVWACTEDRVQAIADVMNNRLSGLSLSDEEIQARIGSAHQSNGEIGLLGIEKPESSEPFGPQVIDGVAVLPVHGVLAPRMSMFMQVSGGTSTQQLMQWIEDSATTSKVNSILLDIDSPGGDAHGNQEVADLIRDVQQTVPVHAHWTNLGASAAYYIGRACGTTSATKSTELGSIATFYVHGETSKADAEAGVTYTVFRGAAYKNAANQHEPLNKKGYEYLNERIGGLHDQFVGSVAQSVGMSVAEVEAQFGAGKLFLAEKAKSLGMVDRVATLKQVFNEMRQTGKAAPGARTTVKAAVAPIVSKESTMNPLIRNAAIEAGLAEADASDGVVQAAVNGFFMFSGKEQPEKAGDVALALLNAAGGTATATTAPTDPPPASRLPPDDPPLDPEAIARDAVSADAARREEIRASGNLLSIDQETIDACCDDPECSIAAADRQFKAIATAANRPLGVGIRVNEASEEKFASAVVDGLFESHAQENYDNYEPKQLSKAATDASNMSPMDLVSRCVNATASKQEIFGQDELGLAALALKGDGSDFYCGMNSYIDDSGDMVSATTMNPASFPNIMSNLAARSINESMQQAESTYQGWAKRRDQDLRDHQIAKIIDTGFLPEFDMVNDDRGSPEVTVAEEVNYIRADDFEQRLKLTPYMIVNGELLTFINWIALAAAAHEATINRSCVNQLVSGQTGDGKALFHADHDNILATGLVPQQTQFQSMRAKLRAQKDPGKERTLGLPLKSLLVPSNLESDTEKWLNPDNRVSPSSDTNGNTFRGKLSYAIEPMLDDLSADKYYGFTSKQRAAAVMYAFRRGYRNMRRRAYLDQATQARIFVFEGSFATAAVNFRGAVENAGTGG